MAKPLSEQIKAAMGPDARVTTVACLIHDVRRAVAEAAAERDPLHAIAVSALSDDATADAAADAEIKAARKLTRLQAQLGEVESRHAELVREAADKKEQAEHDEITAERDQLVVDLKERWPALAAEMVALIERVEASDKRCKAIRILGAEAIAHGVPANYTMEAGAVRRIVELDIAAIPGDGHLLRTGDKYWAMR